LRKGSADVLGRAGEFAVLGGVVDRQRADADGAGGDGDAGLEGAREA